MGKMYEEKKDNEIEKFISSLNEESCHNVNNPWKNKLNKQNLINFLCKYQNAKYILIGEAPGQKGCLQCGVPFCDCDTLIKLLKGYQNDKNNLIETSAQNIYRAFGNSFIAWNVYPYQPCKDNGSNRRPNSEELKYGQTILCNFLKIFENSDKKIIAIGRKAEKILKKDLKYNTVSFLYHPSPRTVNYWKKGGVSSWAEYAQNEIKNF